MNLEQRLDEIFTSVIEDRLTRHEFRSQVKAVYDELDREAAQIRAEHEAALSQPKTIGLK